MLIDASHPEETRVVVLDGQKVEEFDFEAASKRPLKGNIYLAKVTRVEPSLQAAFVEYGGNRQGFLAFSEIHPDYYQIPVADRIALLAEQEADARRRQEDDFESFDIGSAPKTGAGVKESEGGETSLEDASAEEEVFSETDDRSESEFGQAPPEDDDPTEEEQSAQDAYSEESDRAEPVADEGDSSEPAEAQAGFDEVRADTEISEGEAFEREDQPAVRNAEETQSTAGSVESDAAQPLQAGRPSQRWMRKRHYKIQEVIKRRQIILVQVVKEERGNKGAALTTYLSLAGRYCVLMPNTPRGGGISRKITNANDRKRLKSAAQALELPEGMGLIIRTAGENRTKVEIKRDYEYLLRLWDRIRELTLKSNAPACVYEEGDLIKRAIRDLYNKDVTEVVVEGDDGYHNAKDFMRMLMPSHAKNVKPFKEAIPLFQRHHIEAQLDAMFSPTVTLKSGGYIVIDQTEALVSIDVNSGRATREHSIEETATKTNLEASDEIGRQLRLRDLAGLIVIDYIDMEDSRNDRAVEKRLHNAIKNDRARVQIGKISQFGLLEMSRQRLRAGVIAGSTVPCPHCGGQGIVRSVESTSLRVLRGLEEEAQKQRAESLIVRVATDVVIYTLNQKRRELTRLESEYDIAVTFDPKEDLKAGDFDIERIGQRDPESRPKPVTQIEAAPPAVEAEAEPEIVEDAEPDRVEDTMHEEIPAESRQHLQQGENGGRRRRRRRRRGGRDRDRPLRSDQRQEQGPPTMQTAADAGGQEARSERVAREIDEPNSHTVAPPQNGERPQNEQQGQFGEGHHRKRRRRRGRRGGRDRENSGGRADNGAPSIAEAPHEGRFGQPDEIDTTPRDEPGNLTRIPPAPVITPEAIPNAASTPVWSLKAERAEKPPKPLEEKVFAPASVETPREVPAPPQPIKKGWWQRAFRTD
jgi:ribonuclease E